MPYYPANKRYREQNIMQLSVNFNRKTEPELVQKLEQVENKSGYIKSLIRKDIEESK